MRELEIFHQPDSGVPRALGAYGDCEDEGDPIAVFCEFPFWFGTTTPT